MDARDAAIEVFAPRGIDPSCPVLPKLRAHIDGQCDRCGKQLPKGRRRWCSGKCAGWAHREFSKHHDWGSARHYAKLRDKFRCVRCGSKSKVSVNHIVPRNGAGYGRGCHHHLENLETLCQPCHVIETNRQRHERKIAC